MAPSLRTSRCRAGLFGNESRRTPGLATSPLTSPRSLNRSCRLSGLLTRERMPTLVPPLRRPLIGNCPGYFREQAHARNTVDTSSNIYRCLDAVDESMVLYSADGRPTLSGEPLL